MSVENFEAFYKIAALLCNFLCVLAHGVFLPANGNGFKESINSHRRKEKNVIFHCGTENFPVGCESSGKSAFVRNDHCDHLNASVLAFPVCLFIKRVDMVSKGFYVFGKVFCPLGFIGIIKIGKIGIHGRLAVNGNASSAGKVNDHIGAASVSVDGLFVKIDMFHHSRKLGNSAELFLTPFSSLGVVFKGGIEKICRVFKFAVLFLKIFDLFGESAVSGRALLFKFFDFCPKFLKFIAYRSNDSADFVVCAFEENTVVVFGNVLGNACKGIFKA